LDPALRELVTRLFLERSFDFGEILFAEGDRPDGMYVLIDGTVRILVNHEAHEITLARCGPGEWFGETSLLAGSQRTTTVRASEPVHALWLDRLVFDSLLELHPEIRTAFGEQARIQLLHRFLRTHAAFEDLSLEAATAMFPALVPVELAEGAVVVRQGEPGDAMFIVEDGRLEATVTSEADTRAVGFLRAGDVFGERSLETTEPRAASVRALTDTKLWKLNQESFHELVGRFPEFARRINEIASGRDFRKEARIPLGFGTEILPGGLAEPSVADPEVDAPPAPSAVTSRVGAGRRKRFPFVYQLDEMDCGVACLSMIAKWYGIDVSVSWLRDVARAGPSGTTLRGLATAGSLLGLEVVPVKVSRDRLAELRLPAIVHWDAKHWVVMTRLDKDRAEIADPAVGITWFARDELIQHWDGYTAQVTPTGSVPDVPQGGPNLRWLRPFVLAHRRALLGALGLALGAAAGEVALPLIVNLIVDAVINHSSSSVIDLLGLGMLGLAVAGTTASLFQQWMLVGAAARFDKDTLGFITERLLGLPMSYFASRRIGDIERRLTGVREIRRIVVQQGIEALTAAAQVIVGIAVMFYLKWILALAFLAVAPAYLLAMRYSANRLRPLYAGIEESFGRYASEQIDLLKGIETVKSTGTEAGLRRRLQQAFTVLTSRTADSYRTIAGYGSAIQLISLLTYGLFVFLGALLASEGHLNVGHYVAFTVLVLMLTTPLVFLLGVWDDVQVSTVLLNRIADVLEHEPEQGFDTSSLHPVPTLEGRVQLRQVGYQPAGADEPILADVDLDVAPGTTVAIVGRSGSGKSTLLRLLAGLIEPTSGSILYDRADSRSLRYGDLRRQVGFVLQQPYVFAASIVENIALGDDPVDLEAARSAAEIADLAELIERLPLGFDTPVGDSGLPLSGGQAQRLAIARALYRRPPVLLFDEATSNLDTESEAIVKRNIDRLLEGRTAFVVAHRLSTIRNADLIIVLERGRLVEQGTHDELLGRRGIYFYLYSQQLSSPDTG
jgi:ATP-binding cassette subfamily B protein